MTLVLSRLTFDGRHPSARRDLQDAQELHRTLLRAFPDIDGVSPRNRFGVLHRVEDAGLRPIVLVQSRVEPDWAPLAARGLIDAATRSFDPAAFGLRAGRRLRFRLEANPTRKVVRFDDDGARLGQGRRVELRTDEARLEWLVRHGERHGFALDQVHGVVPDVRVSLVPRRHGRRGRGRVALQPVRFEGHLRVVDPLALAEAVGHGIGPGKAYGCGLLSLAPAAV